jgi:hypothetical protein
LPLFTCLLMLVSGCTRKSRLADLRSL